MAAIAIGDCTVTVEAVMSGINMYKIVSPATADDADTIDISTVCDAGNIYSASVEGATDALLTAVVSTAGVLTIPGGQDDEARTCWVLARSPESA
jgi:hypothetical protein